MGGKTQSKLFTLMYVFNVTPTIKFDYIVVVFYWSEVISCNFKVNIKKMNP